MIFVINYRYISFKLPNYRSEKLLITENEKPVFFAFFLAYRGTYNQGKMLTQKEYYWIYVYNVKEWCKFLLKYLHKVIVWHS